MYTYHTMYEDYTHYINPLDFEHVEKAGKWVIRNLSKLMANTAQGVIAPSKKTKQALMDYGVIAPIYIVPTGVDVSRFLRSSLNMEKVRELRASLGFTQKDHVLVFIGRLAKEKSLEMPIRALAKNEDPTLHLVVVGSGTDEEYFKKEAVKCQVENRVHFTGRVAAEDIPYYYAAFDGFVSASLSETQGLTYIEALASGLPVFGRRDEVLEGLIDEGNTGYYFDNEKELNKKINIFFSQSLEERETKRSLCIGKTNDYSITMFGQKAIAVYEQAIEDYKNTFTVDRVRLADDFVYLTLKRDSDTDKTKIMIPLDDYFELKIAVGVKLDVYWVNSYLEMQEYYRAYKAAKRRVLSRDCTAFEIQQYIRRYYTLDTVKIEQMVQEFIEKHWINDEAYAIEKAKYWHETGISKRSIEQKLRKAGINSKWIASALENLLEENEYRNALNVANRLKKSVKEQSKAMKRKTIVKKLLSKGYSLDTAKEVSESLEFDEEDKEALKQALRKAKRLYSSLEPEKQTQKIRLFCLRKGFNRSDIDEWLESGELDD